MFEPIIEDMRDDECYRQFFALELETTAPQTLNEHYRDRYQERIPQGASHRDFNQALSVTHVIPRKALTWCNSYVSADRAEDVLKAYINAHEEMRELLANMEEANIAKPELRTMIADGSRRKLYAGGWGVRHCFTCRRNYLFMTKPPFAVALYYGCSMDENIYACSLVYALIPVEADDMDTLLAERGGLRVCSSHCLS